MFDRERRNGSRREITIRGLCAKIIRYDLSAATHRQDEENCGDRGAIGANAMRRLNQSISQLPVSISGISLRTMAANQFCRAPC